MATKVYELDLFIDVKDFEKRLERFRSAMPKIAKKITAGVFGKMRQDIYKNIRRNFKRHKGRLSRGINYWSFDDFSGSIFTRHSKTWLSYASNLENGAVITPKKSKYLVIYQGRDDKDRPILKQVKSVTIPPRPFFGPVVNDYWGGGGYKARAIAEESLQRWINYYTEKEAGKYKPWTPPDHGD